ncbi:hypothetical protein AAG906_016665 [Vitis piasezkii]
MGIITKSAMVVALATVDDAGTIHSNNSAVPSASGGDPMLDGDGVMEIWMLMWTSNNDCDIREHNMEGFQLLSYFCFPWPVNHTSIRPDRKLATVVGNHLTWMAGRFPQREGASKREHLYDKDPEPNMPGVGCKKKETLIAVLKENLDAMQSICFSSDGQFMMVPTTRHTRRTVLSRHPPLSTLSCLQSRSTLKLFRLAMRLRIRL